MPERALQTGHDPTRLRVRVEGIVQGVGFRPFVYGLAGELGLSGWVSNDTHGVIIEVEGRGGAVWSFRERLAAEAPPLAVIDAISHDRLEPVGDATFEIRQSQRTGRRQTLVSPDVGTCDDCLRELWDPSDRRYRYAFTNCTNCGPRFTIIRDIPYDRPYTTMAPFEMCADCAREYADPSDRRYHAQPVCCPVCGPQLRVTDARGQALDGDALATTVSALRDGAVVAVKGLGGFHLTALAAHQEAVTALRERKHREEKPFAVMVADLEAARRLCEVSRVEAEVLASPRRPIVLLRRRPGAPLAGAVAPGNRWLGLMLPYTPLHHLLAADLGAPFVCTSGNVSDEPIAYDDADAYRRLGDIADLFLVHERAIHARVDDSVTRVFRGREMLLRRSRGYAPQPVPVARAAPEPVLACGAELKNTVCLLDGRRAFVSQHVGDLENYETLRSFTESIEHLSRLFELDPRLVAHDLHPEYLSTKHALDLPGVELVGVQHHHAHVASCMAEHGEAGPVIGVAFDGLGFGTDGTIWGGELLIADLTGFERAGHLATVRMPGGERAIREPWRMAAAHLQAALGDRVPEGLAVLARNQDRWSDVLAVAGAGVNSPVTSSAGRLFDAVSAIVGVRDRISYEGQAAIELEQRADPAEGSAYPAGLDGLDGDGPLRLRCADLVRGVVDDVLADVDSGRVAARFHNGLAELTRAAVEALRERTGLEVVALSGGVFQNVLLLERLVPALEGAGLRVLVHSRVPPNDGGISLGQAAIAAATGRQRR